MLAPELKELQQQATRATGSRQQAAHAGVLPRARRQPAGGCLPTLLQLALLIPMYSVFSQGLTNYDPSAMVTSSGSSCSPDLLRPRPSSTRPATSSTPCLNPVDLREFNWGLPEPETTGWYSPASRSALAIISALLQLIASRMALPPARPGDRRPETSRSSARWRYFLPFISLPYGSLLPAGLFLYWIVSTLYPDHPAVPDHRLGRHVPALRLDPGFARGSQAAVPGHAARRSQPPKPGQRRRAASARKPSTRTSRPTATIRPNRTRPPGPTRETTLT